jgi:hypothetical protein
VPAPPALSCSDAYCETDKALFVDSWPKAWHGEYQAQRNLAVLFGSKEGPVKYNPVQACAWRMVIIASGDPKLDETDGDNLDRDCAVLTGSQALAARSSAGHIYSEITGRELPLDVPR